MMTYRPLLFTAAVGVAGCSGSASSSAAPVTVEEAPPPPSIRDVVGQCGVECVESMPAFATQRMGQSGEFTFLKVAESMCRLPDYAMTPEECTATCKPGTGMESVQVSFGALSPRVRIEMCRAIVRDRGEPENGGCEELGDSPIRWAASEGQPALTFEGHLEYTCG